jgi:hypothetical protein
LGASILVIINLTPSVPLSLKGEGEENKKERALPLLDSL